MLLVFFLEYATRVLISFAYPFEYLLNVLHTDALGSCVFLSFCWSAMLPYDLPEPRFFLRRGAGHQTTTEVVMEQRLAGEGDEKTCFSQVDRFSLEPRIESTNLIYPLHMLCRNGSTTDPRLIHVDACHPHGIPPLRT